VPGQFLGSKPNRACADDPLEGLPLCKDDAQHDPNAQTPVIRPRLGERVNATGIGSSDTPSERLRPEAKQKFPLLGCDSSPPVPVNAVKV
jgi:hypothetical protein